MLPPPVRTSKNVVTLSCVSKRNAADATFCMLLLGALQLASVLSRGAVCKLVSRLQLQMWFRGRERRGAELCLVS